MPIGATIYDETIKNGFAKLLAVNTAANSSTLDFTITSEYDSYLFDIDKLIPPTTDLILIIHASSNGGSSWASSYSYCGFLASTALGGPSQVGNPGGTIMGIHIGTNATTPISGRVRLWPVGVGTNRFLWHIATVNATHPSICYIGGGSAAITGLNAVRFGLTSGVITAGSIRLYGLKRGV